MGERVVRQAHHERIGDEMNGWMDGMAVGIGVGCVRGFLIPHCVRNDRGGAFGMVGEIVVVCLEWCGVGGSGFLLSQE